MTSRTKPGRVIQGLGRRLGHEIGRNRAEVQRRAQRPRAPKVSVIIATYNTEPAGLQRLVEWFDAQTLPQHEFEVLFVDDGSTDNTLERLEEYARTRMNYVVRSIPNSGWASRPRNLGLDEARGEYVLFLDHDDAVYPTGLERGYAFGAQHAADIVNAKEVRTTAWSWGWSEFVTDVPNATYIDPNPLLPMTPHKLYRRAFVQATGVRFPEAARSMWEDNYFNIGLYAHNPRISVLSSTPFYFWDTGVNNTHKTFDREPAEYWGKLTGLLRYIARELEGNPAGQLIVDHYVALRMLGLMGPDLLQRTPEYVAIARRHTREAVTELVGPGYGATLPAVTRARLELIRNGTDEQQLQLSRADDGVTVEPTVTELAWDGAELLMSAIVTLLDSSGEPLRIRRDGDRWVRDLPPEVTAGLSASALEVTAERERATFRLSVRGRESRASWPLAGEGQVHWVEDGAGFATLTAEITARFDPIAFAAAHDLGDAVWDFAGRLEVFGYTLHRGLRGGHPTVALLSGVPVVGYRNKSGLFSLDVAAAVRTVTGSAPPPGADVAVEKTASGELRAEVTAPLPDVHCAGASIVSGQAVLGDGSEVPAQLVGRAGGAASLRFTATLAPGEYPVQARFLGRTGRTGLTLVVGTDRADVRASS